MLENEQLLKAVLDKPDDDAPRLAYAEWCKNTDAARSEFIRLQLALAKTNGNTNEPEVFRLALKSNNLVKTHGARWAGPLVPPGTSYEFHRGFVELVAVSAASFLERAPTLFSRSPIRHIDFLEVHGTAPKLFLSPLLAPIRSLNLDRGGLSDDDMRSLADCPHLPNLRWLSLAENRIDFFGINLLASSKNFPALKWVNFRGNLIDPGEQFSSDQGVIADSWLPDEGKRLEQMHGPIRWLHVNAGTTRDLPPNRFRIGG